MYWSGYTVLSADPASPDQAHAAQLSREPFSSTVAGINMFPRWPRGMKPSRGLQRFAIGTAIVMNGGFAQSVYKSPPTGWRDGPGLIIGFIAWNLLPAILFGIVFVLRKQGH